MSLPPQEMFKVPGQTELYSQYDEDGVPTHDSAGEKVIS
jgi:hypothetical protein